MPTTATYNPPVTDRAPAFHSLGTIFPEGTTIEQGLDAAHLSNWNVRTEPLTVVTSDGMFPMPRHQVIMRDNPETGSPEPIAPTGKQYTAVQNEELAEFAALVLDESDLTLDSAGSTNGGRRVFMVLASPETVTYGETDTVAPYMVLATGHDGGLATIMRPLFMRLRCTNQLTGILYASSVRQVLSEFRVRHTSSIEGRVQQARDALNLRWKAQDALDKEIERLLSVPVSANGWGAVVDALAPITDDLKPAGVTRREKMRDDLWGLWNADTQKPIKGTAWAAVNAVGEYFDWFGPGADDTAKRAASQMFGSRESTKAAATRKTLAVLGV